MPLMWSRAASRTRAAALRLVAVSIAFESLLDDRGSPLLPLSLNDKMKTESFIEVAGRVETGEGP